MRAQTPSPAEALKQIAELRYVEDANEPFDDALDIADASLPRAEAEERVMAALVEALEPLAAIADWYAPEEDDKHTVFTDFGQCDAVTYMPLGAARKAAEALAQYRGFAKQAPDAKDTQ